MIEPHPKVGKLYRLQRVQPLPIRCCKYSWSAVISRRGGLGAADALENEVFLYLGIKHRPRVLTWRNREQRAYMTFLDSTGTIICFSQAVTPNHIVKANT